jgi:hypothetical protein
LIEYFSYNQGVWSFCHHPPLIERSVVINKKEYTKTGIYDRDPSSLRRPAASSFLVKCFASPSILKNGNLIDNKQIIEMAAGVPLPPSLTISSLIGRLGNPVCSNTGLSKRGFNAGG